MVAVPEEETRRQSGGGLLLDVPNLSQEWWQLLVLHLEREAHLGVHVAQGAQLGQDGQQPRKVVLARRPVVLGVHPKRLNVVLLDALHLVWVHQRGALCKGRGWHPIRTVRAADKVLVEFSWNKLTLLFGAVSPSPSFTVAYKCINRSSRYYC